MGGMLRLTVEDAVWISSAGYMRFTDMAFDYIVLALEIGS